MTESVRETFNNKVQEEEEEQMRLGKDSMISFNERGCDEIMSQFIKDLDSTYDIYNEVEVEDVIEPNDYSSVKIETIL
jgi:hypothetical protein